MSEIKASREAIMDLVHRFAGDDHLDEFNEAVAAFERDATYHWKTEFETCHDELSKAETERDRYLSALYEIANPVPAMEARAKAEGCVLNGAAVVQILESRHTYHEIARNALK